MAQMVLTAAGSAIAGPVGGFVGSLVGGAIDNKLFGPGDTRSDAPPLESLTVSIGADNQPIPDGFGRHPRVGRLIWSDEKKENRESETTGGKDFGGPKHTTTTINPTVTCAYSFGYGPGRPIWIKANKRLIADFRPDSTTVFADGLTVNIYDGTQTEPSYLAESIFPAAPAYVGQIIVEFENLPIAQFGNDPPQILEAMVIMNTDSVSGSTEIAVDPEDVHSLGYQFHDEKRGHLWMTWDDGNDAPQEFVIGVMDIATRTWIYQQRLPYTQTGDFPGNIHLMQIINSDLTVEEIIVVNAENRIYIFDPDTVSLKNIHVRTSGGSIFSAVNNVGMLSQEHSGGGGAAQFSLWSQYSELDFIQNPYATGVPDYTVMNEAVCAYPETFLFFLRKNTDNTLALAEWRTDAGSDWSPVQDQTVIDGGVTWEALKNPVYASSTNTYFVRGTVNYIAGQESVLFEVDMKANLVEIIRLSTLGYTHTTWDLLSGDPILRYDSSRDLVYWKRSSDMWEYSLVSRTLQMKPVGVFSTWSHYDQRTDTVFGGVISGIPGSGVSLTKLNSVDNTQVSVADALTRVCELAGVPTSRINASDITATMWGAPILIGSAARTTLESLLLYANGFGVMAGDQIRFSEFGGPVVKNIDREQLGARVVNESRPDSRTREIPQAVSIPAIMDLSYVSVNAEGETSIARSAYHFGDRKRPIKQENIVVMDSAQAAIMINRIHQSVVNQTEVKGMRILPYHLDLESGDVITLTDASEVLRIIVTDMKISPTLGIQIEGIVEDSEDSVAYGVGANDTIKSEVSGSQTPQLLVFDTALLRDVDDKNHAGPYTAMYRVGTTVNNAAVYGSASGETYNYLTSIPNEATVGICSNSLGTVTTFDAWDESTLTVNIVSGSAPSSLTDPDILAGGNACLYGRTGRWELIQAGTWTLVSGTTYDVTHILRGRRGTDPFINTHESGDYLVLLTDSTIRRLVLSATLIDSTYNVKALGPGDTLTGVSTKTIALAGNAMKPYTVINVVRSGTTDHVWTWEARTRVGGVYGGTNSLIDGVQGSQTDGLEFEIDIWNLNQTVKYNTRLVSGQQWDYTAARRAEDGLTSTQNYLAVIYHMNGSIRGYGKNANSLGDSYSQICLNLTPVLYYAIDETTGTVVDNATGDASLDGSYNGTYTLDQQTIIEGEDRSAYFDYDAYVNIPDAVRTPLSNVPGVTLVCTVDLDDPLPSVTKIFGLCSSSEYPIEIDISTGSLRGFGRTNSVYPIKSVTTPITSGRHHIALVIDPPNDKLMLYLDGQLANELNPAGFNWTTDFRALGSAPTGGRIHHVFGGLDAFREYSGFGQGAGIYAKVLTTEEIGALASFVVSS